MNRRCLMFLALALVLLGAGIAPGQEVGGVDSAPVRVADSGTSVTKTSPGNTAIDFLRRVEKKNAETKTLQAEFTQVRKDLIYDVEVRSNGRFWYKAPGLFRASYDAEADNQASEIWMRDNQLINYLPGLKQVEIIEQRPGAKEPINQMLLGFGVKVEQIEEVFDVKASPKGEKGLMGIQFDSKDLEQSMQFTRVTIYFDEQKVEPAKIVLEDDSSIIRLELKKVRFNPSVDEKLFKTSWPGDAQVFRYTAG